jgi:hypothetical protein
LRKAAEMQNSTVVFQLKFSNTAWTLPLIATVDRVPENILSTLQVQQEFTKSG